jgi:hypothetical protein
MKPIIFNQMAFLIPDTGVLRVIVKNPAETEKIFFPDQRVFSLWSDLMTGDGEL